MNFQKVLTICIPTFNRAEMCSALIDSLPVHPSVEYLIIDDGSKTEESLKLQQHLSVVEKDVRYISKKTGGKVSAVLHGARNALGKFCMALDDDDLLNAGQLKHILEDIEWFRSYGSGIAGGLCGLNIDEKGSLIGSAVPELNYPIALAKLYAEHRVSGDKKLILKTKILSGYQMQFYPGEPRIPPSALWNAITFIHPVHCKNRVYATRRYMTDGMSKNLLPFRIQSPNSSRIPYRDILLNTHGKVKSFHYRMKCLINYCRFGFHGGRPFIERKLMRMYWIQLIWTMPIAVMMYCRDLIHKAS